MQGLKFIERIQINIAIMRLAQMYKARILLLISKWAEN